MKADYERIFELAKTCQEKGCLFKPFASLNSVDKDANPVKFLSPEIVSLETILNQQIIKQASNEKEDFKKKVEQIQKENHSL